MSVCVVFVFFFKQKTAYEIVSRDWSSDVCSSDPLYSVGHNVNFSFFDKNGVCFRHRKFNFDHQNYSCISMVTNIGLITVISCKMYGSYPLSFLKPYKVFKSCPLMNLKVCNGYIV